MRLRFLDGLRGLAALIVVIDHFAISFFPAAVDIDAPAHHRRYEWLFERTPLHLLVAGNFSVCIFFVLSGFVLSAKFFSTGRKEVILPMAIKRYWRFAFPVASSVILAYVLISTHSFHNMQLFDQTGSLWLQRFWRDMPSFGQALYHGFIAVFITGKSDNFNTVLWTMKVELVGSFLVFATIYVFGKARYRWFIYGALLLLLHSSYYTAFVAGMALSDYYQGSDVPKLKTYLQGGWWIALGVVGLYLGSSPVDSLRSTPFVHLANLMPTGLTVSMFTHILGAILLVSALLYSPVSQRLLSTKYLTYLGDLSFSLYLTHLLVLGSFSAYVFTHLPTSLNYGHKFIITAIPSLIVMWGIAHLFMKYIDMPSMRFASYFYARVRGMYEKLKTIS